MAVVRHCWTASLALSLGATPLVAQSRAHFHHLEPTPTTVAWGYYDAKATPVLRVQSGDTVELHTLITSTPQRLEAAGVAPGDVEQARRDIPAPITTHGP